MHIYHYGAYEKTALLHLAARYGLGEDEVDDLLRDDVLVDLLPVVRKSIRVGAESYGLKALERYMGNGRRSGDVTTAADSITQYARYTELMGKAAPTKRPGCSRRSRTTTTRTASRHGCCETSCCYWHSNTALRT